MKETIEHNNRFYGEELKTESEQLKEWLVIANMHNEELQKERDMYKTSFETMSTNYFRLENIIKEVRETLINSKEYKMAKEMNLTSKMSVLIELLEILDKVGSDKERGE